METVTKESSITANVDGKDIVFETGKWAKQANASVTARSGDTLVLVTVVVAKESKPEQTFLPLLVDVEERMYAAGKIPGGFFKREGRPSEESILTARLIDRPLRPSFPKGFRNDIQVIATILSADQMNPPDILAMLAASTALTISDIPFNGPLAMIRVGRVDGRLIFNPTFQELEVSDFELLIAGNKDEILMVEGEAREIPEKDVVEVFRQSMDQIRILAETQERFRSEVGLPKREFPLFRPDQKLEEAVAGFAKKRLDEALHVTDRPQRQTLLDAIKEEAHQKLDEIFPEQIVQIDVAIEDMAKAEVRRMITEDGIRVDGRKPDELRPLTCEVGLLPRAHGSGLFARGQTQTLTALTLGAIGEIQKIDGLGIEESKRFLHHYNFPPFSTGETGFMRGPRRREIGHGALVERALLQIIPKEEDFPYTIRLVSEVLESNGSTSMASLCSSTLALMDAGIPIKAPAAGISIGLIKEDDKLTLLTDIQGIEDFYGDMDFKVAGTRQGVTSLQMDLKVPGISFDILAEALERSRQTRLAILDFMAKTIAEPREKLSTYAPRVLIIRIPTDKIREVIGPGGNMIRSIIEETGVAIDIEDDGRVFITSKDEPSADKARQIIERITQKGPSKQTVKVGEQYTGTVVSIVPFGAFVEILPGRDGLIHISKLAHHRVARVEDVVRVGEKILVEVIGVDQQGRISLAPADLKSAPSGTPSD